MTDAGCSSDRPSAAVTGASTTPVGTTRAGEVSAGSGAPESVTVGQVGETGETDISVPQPLTLPPTTLPADAPSTSSSATTIRPATTVSVAVVTIAGAPTTGASATTVGNSGASTTTLDDVVDPSSTLPGPPCVIELVVEQTETGFDGITPQGLRCASDWAAWTGAADDPTGSDSFFAVAQWSGSAWQLRNLGTAGVCEEGDVPQELWTVLACLD